MPCSPPRARPSPSSSHPSLTARLARRTWLHAVCLPLAALLLAGCGEPPHKEMDQAHGAIEAARAAGAERYAQEEFNGATAALQLAHEAVGDGDYRLALNYAIDSLERAQNSARLAADLRAQRRGEVERAMAEVMAVRAQADTQLTAIEARAPRAAVTRIKQALAEVDAEVQEAGAMIEAGDYIEAQPLLQAVKEQIEGINAEIGELSEVQSARRRR